MLMKTTTYSFTFEIRDELPLTKTQLQMIRVGFSKVIESCVLKHRSSAGILVDEIRETVIIKPKQD